MQISETTQTRHDFTATEGGAEFSARLYEGAVTVSVSGLQSAPATFVIPADRLGDLAQFVTLVASQIDSP